MKSGFIISTRAQLYLGAGTILACVIIVIMAGIAGTQRIDKINSKIEQSHQISNLLTEMKLNQTINHSLALQMVMTSDPVLRLELETKIRSQADKITTFHGNMEQLLLIYPETLTKYKEVEALFTDYRQNRERQFMLLKEGKHDDAEFLTTTTQIPLFETLLSNIEEIQGDLIGITQQLTIEATNVSIRARTLIWIPGGISILVVGLMVAWARWVIRSLNKEINEGISILEVTANEILTTATEVSTGATETATSVAETTTTIEEVRQTSQLANKKAIKVLENSQKASDVAENGKAAVMKTIEGMERIKAQMDLIAASIIQLADQSRVIGDITTTVTDLADQSNLLAVNAAIEAAKAGEQGRGFAVVAQEIRSLAEQSKKSTSQVKDILNEVQKSVSHAVMATEQGSKAVESGSALANESGEVIELLAETVEEAAQSALQISSSTNEQMAGMDQIVPAMENIKQASEQNVIGTRQTQTVATNLAKLSETFKVTTRKFNV
ncbi:MAG: methyl-accepting chemotaxis protein [Bacteroidales bacterium]|nr:methyl-accepting chemotaxis protein [Bacteroidales bacterium]